MQRPGAKKDFSYIIYSYIKKRNNMKPPVAPMPKGTKPPVAPMPTGTKPPVTGKPPVILPPPVAKK